MHSPKRKNQAVDGSKAISGVGTAKSISSISITCVELGSNSMEGFEVVPNPIPARRRGEE